MLEVCLHTFHDVIQINARAQYSLSFEGAYPDLYLPKDNDSTISDGTPTEDDILPRITRGKWILYLPKAYHPLLLQKHCQSLRMAMKDLSNANAVC